MKYSESNKPLVCMMTQSTCYKGTSKMKPLGVLWHSTGANNPTLKRYVQPDDNASNREELIALIGKNQYKNDWKCRMMRRISTPSSVVLTRPRVRSIRFLTV